MARTARAFQPVVRLPGPQRLDAIALRLGGTVPMPLSRRAAVGILVLSLLPAGRCQRLIAPTATPDASTAGLNKCTQRQTTLQPTKPSATVGRRLGGGIR
eukprot:3951494-Pleurochrysis_carterae.AAC.3